jgi:hypothetical protein
MSEPTELLSISDASEFASQLLNKPVSPSNCTTKALVFHF